MRTVALDGGRTRNGFGSYMPGLIEALGTREFAAEFFSAVSQVFDCVHLNAFSTPKKFTAPRTVFAGSTCGSGIARLAASRYLHYWQHDPVVRPLIGKGNRQSCELLIKPSQREFAEASYRRQCYDPDDWIDHGANIVDRISLVRIDCTRILFVNLYRDKPSGPFRDSELDELKSASGFLFALVTRQSAEDPGLRNARTIAEGVAHIEAALPDLPRRESQVCAGIAIGMSSEGIALELGITMNTVLTYRKRIYARLGISSQNELIRLVMPSHGPAPMDLGSPPRPH